MNVAVPAGRPREIWTRLTVDPLAEPLSRRLARSPLVTPNRITSVAIACAAACAVCFATGLLRAGGALFLLRFFVDCLDGKVARAQGSSSARGAALDLIADVTGIAAATAALSWRLVRDDVVLVWVPVALLASMIVYNWALAYRKSLAHDLGVGDGGADHTRAVRLPVVGAWVALCRRLNMSPVPWALEAEIVMLGLGPLLLPESWLAYTLALGLAFYLLADAVNLRRVWRLAGQLDRTRAKLDERCP